MSTLGFEDYIEPLKTYLQRYRDHETGEKANATGKPGGAGEGDKSLAQGPGGYQGAGGYM